MGNDELKLELIQKLIKCEDTALLMELQEILEPMEETGDTETTIEFIPDKNTEDPEDFSLDDPDQKQ